MRQFHAARQRGSAGYDIFVVEQIRLGNAAIQSGNREQAITIRNRIRDFNQKAVAFSKDGLNFLLDLGLFDEAEAMMQEGRRRYPRHDHFAGGYIQVAYRRGDMQEALRRCEVIRRSFPGLADGYTVAAACLADLGRHDEAEAMMNQAVHKLPRNFDVLADHARHAVRRQDWREALRRWELVNARFEHFLGPVGIAQSLREMARYAEAEKVATEAHERFPTVTWPSVELAAIAAAQGDYQGAARCWASLRKDFPLFRLAYSSGIETAIRAGWEGEADAILRQGVTWLRWDLEIHLEYARSAEHRGDWATAAERWAFVRERFPDSEEASKQQAHALAALAR